MRRAPLPGEDRYRIVPEPRVIELLLFQGWPHAVRAGRRGEAEREARAALDRCVADGLPYRRSATGERLFDNVEVSNFLEWTGLTGGGEVWKERCIATARRLVSEAWPGGR